MDKENIKRDFNIASKNLFDFIDYEKDNHIQILNGVSIVINKMNIEAFENLVDDIYVDLIELTEILRSRKEFLVFIEFDEQGNVYYEL